MSIVFYIISLLRHQLILVPFHRLIKNAQYSKWTIKFKQNELIDHYEWTLLVNQAIAHKVLIL